MSKILTACSQRLSTKRLLAGFAACILGGSAGLTVAPTTADARIECRGEFQYSGGNWIATPYCADFNLAQVARTYGMRVSFDALRYSPSEKERVCRAIGHDPRVTNACVGYRPEDGGRRWTR